MNTLVWRGIAYQSLEYFKLTGRSEDYIAESTIVGRYQEVIYCVTYRLVIDYTWLIQEFHMVSEINGIQHTLKGKKTGNQWEINDVINSDFNGFEYIDISLTPFTNTLPINHLVLNENRSKEINVIYIDVLNSQIKPVSQRYTKLEPYKYLYENTNNDFKATILVDETGLVINYPGLFEKAAEFRIS